MRNVEEQLSNIARSIRAVAGQGSVGISTQRTGRMIIVFSILLSWIDLHQTSFNILGISITAHVKGTMIVWVLLAIILIQHIAHFAYDCLAVHEGEERLSRPMGRRAAMKESLAYVFKVETFKSIRVLAYGLGPPAIALSMGIISWCIV